MAHEIGHDINWPDLYDVDYTSSGVGYWSLMASGSWSDAGGEPGSSPSLPDAWSRWYQGWVTPTTVAAHDRQPGAQRRPGRARVAQPRRRRLGVRRAVRLG